jgi:hypothetical protein
MPKTVAGRTPPALLKRFLPAPEQYPSMTGKKICL